MSLVISKNDVLITLCGTALMMTQYIGVREIGSTFFSTELITLIAVVISLAGLSVAYAVSDLFWDDIDRLKLTDFKSPTPLQVGFRASVRLNIAECRSPFGL